MRERELADKAKVIAVVGASPDIYRPSNTVMRYLVAAGYDVRPVRPGGGTISVSYTHLDVYKRQP